MSPTIIKVILLTVVVQIGCVSNRVSCSLDALYEQASALEVGIMMALFAFVPALFAIRSGQWIDSVGPKKPVLIGIAIMSVAAFLPLALDVKTFGLWPLFAACMINGLGFMLVQMTNQQLVGTSPKPKAEPIILLFWQWATRRQTLARRSQAATLLTTWAFRVPTPWHFLPLS